MRYLHTLLFALLPLLAQALTINEFSRNFTVFDSGAVLKRNAAVIPLSGAASGDDGKKVEARAVNADTGDAVVGWQTLGNVTNGQWSGALKDVPRTSEWLRIEARVAGSSDVVKTENRFAAGHVWALYEQSNWARLFMRPFSKTKPDTVLEPGNVQIFQVNRKNAEITRVLITNETPITSAMVAYANAFSAERPGDKLALAAHVQSGSSPVDMIGAPEVKKSKRDWANEVALHQAITADGSPVGLVTVNGWIAFNGGRPNNDDIFVPILIGQQVDGKQLQIGDTVENGRDGFTLVHCLTEFYDWDYTRFTMIGPHGRAQSGSIDGYDSKDNVFYEKMVDDWRATLSNSSFPMFLPHSFEAQSGLRGHAKGNGWTDYAHHAPNDKDGQERLARIGMAATLYSAGLVDWPLPAFTNIYREPNGDYIDFWMEGKNITTERLRRGMGPIPATNPSRTEVMGFAIDRAAAQRAEIIENAGGSGFAGVRVFPNEGQFTTRNDVQFGLGKLPGFQVFPDDFQDQYILNLPVVDVGQKDLPALPVAPRSTQLIGQ